MCINYNVMILRIKLSKDGSDWCNLRNIQFCEMLSSCFLRSCKFLFSYLSCIKRISFPSVRLITSCMEFCFSLLIFVVIFTACLFYLIDGRGFQRDREDSRSWAQVGCALRNAWCCLSIFIQNKVDNSNL